MYTLWTTSKGKARVIWSFKHPAIARQVAIELWGNTHGRSYTIVNEENGARLTMGR